MTSPNTQTHSWTSFPIGRLNSDHRVEISQGTTTLADHYFFVFASGTRNNYYKESKLWMVNLQDTDIQEFSSYFGYAKENYSLNTYGENQMIKFGGDAYKALTIVSEQIDNNDAPCVSGHTATIYQDFLYVFGGRNRTTDEPPSNKLWCFDLKKRVWKLCETTGQGPKAREGAKSFVSEDNLYIYGGVSQDEVSYCELSELNLNTMNWRIIVQENPRPGQDSKFFERFSADIYEEKMIVIKNEKKTGFDRVYCCNQHDLGDWTMIDVNGLGGIRTIGNMVIYKNVLYTFATKNAEREQLFLAALDLGNINLPPPRKSLEEEQFSSLFLSDNESDIVFKIQGKIIPAHKRVLIQKCRFFANLFNSGMMESRLEAIDIDDCEYDIFQEFLRFLYCGTLNIKPSQATKLLSLADKYVQEDLHKRCINMLAQQPQVIKLLSSADQNLQEDFYERCMNRLALNVTSKNICSTYNFARKNDVPLLRGWCMKFFEYGMNYDYITQFVEYVKDLESQNDPKYKADDRKLMDKAVSEILKRVPAILKEDTQDFNAFVKDKKRIEFFEDFLEKHITTENVEKYTKKFGEFKNQMSSLRKTVLKFVFINHKFLHKEGVVFKLGTDFGDEFFHYKKRKIEEKKVGEAIQKENDIGQRKALKRMDPKSDSIREENTDPSLKKMKKPLAALGN